MEVSLIPIGIAASRAQIVDSADVDVGLTPTSSASEPLNADQSQGEFPAILAQLAPPPTLGTRTNQVMQSSSTARPNRTAHRSGSTTVNTAAKRIEMPQVGRINSDKTATLSLSIAPERLLISNSVRRPEGHDSPLQIRPGSTGHLESTQGVQVAPTPDSEAVVLTLGGEMARFQRPEPVTAPTEKRAQESVLGQPKTVSKNTDQRGSDDHRIAAVSWSTPSILHDNTNAEAIVASFSIPTKPDVPLERHRQPYKTPEINRARTDTGNLGNFDTEATATVRLAQQRADQNLSSPSIVTDRPVESVTGSIVHAARPNDAVPRDAADKVRSFDGPPHGVELNVRTTTRSNQLADLGRSEVEAKPSSPLVDDNAPSGLSDVAKVSKSGSVEPDSRPNSARELTAHDRADVQQRGTTGHVEPPRTDSVRRSVIERVSKPHSDVVSQLRQPDSNTKVSAEASPILDRLHATSQDVDDSPRPTDPALRNESGERTVNAHLPTENVTSRRMPEPTLVRQIAQPVFEQVTNGTLVEKRELRVKLRPPELGELVIRLEETRVGIAARIVVTSDAALQTLESNLPDLMRSLGEAGIELSGFQLSRNGEGLERDGDRSRFGGDESTTFSSSPNKQNDSSNGRQGSRTHRINVIA